MNLLKQFGNIAMAVAILFWSCSSEEEVNPNDAPQMPPSASMEIDFSNFTSANNNNGRQQASYNWGSAVTVVGIWNTVLTVGLAIPVASFKAAVSQKPTFNADRGVWVWEFDHNILGRTYSFELTGKQEGDLIIWNMYASQEGGFQDVLWYTGEVAADGTSGSWTLNKDGNNPTAYLKVDWSVENNEVANIKYTNIDAASNEFGSYIEYGKSAGADFNRFYNIMGAEGQVQIEWNADTGAGMLQRSQGTPLCWNELFEDIACQ